MDDKEIKEILKDPKKLLDIFRIFHRLLHVYETQEMVKQGLKSGSNEKIGLTDSVEIKLTKANSNKTQEVK